MHNAAITAAALAVAGVVALWRIGPDWRTFAVAIAGDIILRRNP